VEMLALQPVVFPKSLNLSCVNVENTSMQLS
jgi:hypothetical protein